MKKRNNYLEAYSIRIVLFAILFTITVNCLSQDTIKISYIGNMGVLIGNNQRSVLIDGFHKEYKPQYLFPPDSLVTKMISGSHENFTPIDVAMATHHHRDHFDPSYFYSFLNSNKSSIAILSPQIKELLQKEAKKRKGDLSEQLKTTDHNGTTHTFEHNGIEIKSFQIDHTNPSRHRLVENTAYIVKIDEISVLHVGDSNWDVAEKHLKANHNLLKDLDVAILPYWMLLEGKSAELVDRLMAPRNIIATHIPPNFDKSHQRSISESFENVQFFTEIGQAVEVYDIK